MGEIREIRRLSQEVTDLLNLHPDLAADICPDGAVMCERCRYQLTAGGTLDISSVDWEALRRRLVK